MNKNVGSIDKNIRLILGIILIVLSFFSSLWWLGLVGVILIGTALMNFCPIWALLKISTKKATNEK